MADGRGFRAGAFALELEGKIAGYVQKIDLGALKTDVASVNLGPTNRIKKYVTKMSWAPIKFEVGLSMGDEVRAWLQSSFDRKHLRKSGAFIMFDHNYEAQRRCDFTDAHITEIVLPACDPKNKTAPHFQITIQPEVVRFTSGGGKVNPVIAQAQKLHGQTNFNIDVPGLPSKAILKVDSVKWNCAVTEDALGEFVESQYVPTKVECGDIKVSVAGQHWEAWYKDAHKDLVLGQRTEAGERTIAVNILGPDAKKEVATIEFTNCGWKEFQFEAMTANEDKVSAFNASFYCEGMKLEIAEKT